MHYDEYGYITLHFLRIVDNRIAFTKLSNQKFDAELFGSLFGISK